MALQDMITARGLKQNFLARQIGLSVWQFSRVARGLDELPASKVVALASAMGVDPAEVLAAIGEAAPEAASK